MAKTNVSRIVVRSPRGKTPVIYDVRTQQGVTDAFGFAAGESFDYNGVPIDITLTYRDGAQVTAVVTVKEKK